MTSFVIITLESVKLQFNLLDYDYTLDAERNFLGHTETFQMLNF